MALDTVEPISDPEQALQQRTRVGRMPDPVRHSTRGPADEQGSMDPGTADAEDGVHGLPKPGEGMWMPPQKVQQECPGMESLIPVPSEGQETSRGILVESGEQRSPQRLEEDRQVLEPVPTGRGQDFLELVAEAFDQSSEADREVRVARTHLVEERVAQLVEPALGHSRRGACLPEAGP
jgi:hypothetical protein